MNKTTPAKTRTSKTKAGLPEVFEYCDRKVALGEVPTYDVLAKHFEASNDTVGPHFRAWKELHEASDIWDMPEAVTAMLQDAQHTVWRAMSRIAQSKLVCETHDLKRQLKEAAVKLASCDEVNENLQQQLTQEKELRKSEANDALQTASDLYAAQQEAQEAKQAAAQLPLVQAELAAVQQQLHAKTVEVATLNGIIEGIRSERGNT